MIVGNHMPNLHNVDEVAKRRFRLASTASFSICFGAGLRQLAGRSVILE
jgi:hypothetical protein